MLSTSILSHEDTNEYYLTTPSSSAKTVGSDKQSSLDNLYENPVNISYKSRKSVRFSDKDQIFLIPGLKNQYNIRACAPQLSLLPTTATPTKLQTSSIIQETKPIKKVTFAFSTKVVRIPNRSQLKSFSNLLWYDKVEIKRFKTETLAALELHISKGC